MKIIKYIVLLVCIAFCFTGCSHAMIADSPQKSGVADLASFTYEEWDFDAKCSEREEQASIYAQKVIEANDYFQTTEGSKIVGYYDENEELKMLKISFYGETGRAVISFYPYDDIIAIIKTQIRYASPLFSQDEHIEYTVAIRKMIINNNDLYYFIDNNEQLFLSKNAAEYLECYETAKSVLK